MERHVVITGASGGIGKVVLKHILENGYTVYAACRDSSRLKEFSDYMPDSLHPIILDMESLACVGKFCSEVAERLSGCRIDMLINNAGMIAPVVESTADGYERSLQVNYIAPKLITERLAPHIAPGGKVINTLSCTINNGNFIQMEKHPSGQSIRESTISSLKHYSDAKYMMALYTVNFAQAHKEITVCAADPGIVNTGIITMHRWYDPLADIFFRPFIKSPARGARPIINAIEFTGTGENGKVLFFKGNKITGLGRKFLAAAEREREITTI